MWVVRLIIYFDGIIPETAREIRFNIDQEGVSEYHYPWFGILSKDQISPFLAQDDESIDQEELTDQEEPV